MTKQNAEPISPTIRTALWRLCIAGMLWSLLCSFSSAAHAQGRLLHIGAGFLGTMDLGLETSYTDNFFRQPQREQSAFGVHLLPQFTVATERQHVRSQLDFEGEYARFSIDGAPNSEDSFFDIRTNGRLAWQPARRHGFSLDLLHHRSHDPFGTERTEEIDDLLAERELDRWLRNRGLLRYLFGAEGATLNLSVRGGEIRKRYLNNREATRFLDHRVTTVGGTAFYNFSPRTAAILDVEGNRIRFDEDFPGDDAVQRGAEEFRVRAGAQWRATARTAGDVRVGYLVRDFDDPERSNFNAVSWQAGITWIPRHRTGLELTTGRVTTESFRVDSRFLDDRFVQLDWRQDWTGRLRSVLSARYSDLDFVDSPRSDDILRLRGTLSYQMTRRLTTRVGLRFADRDSEEAPRNFDKLDAVIGLSYRL